MSPKNAALIAGLTFCLAIPLPALAAPAPAAATAASVLTVNADRSSAVTTADHHTNVVYSGHVVIRRGELTLRGDRAVIHMQAQTIDTVHVTGQPARFELQSTNKPTIEGEARTITYQAGADTLEMDDQVRFSRPGETFSADHLLYRIKTRELEAHGNDHGRVHAVMTAAAGTAR